jgi:hypothetical protein
MTGTSSRSAWAAMATATLGSSMIEIGSAVAPSPRASSAPSRAAREQLDGGGDGDPRLGRAVIGHQDQVTFAVQGRVPDGGEDLGTGEAHDPLRRPAAQGYAHGSTPPRAHVTCWVAAASYRATGPATAYVAGRGTFGRALLLGLEVLVAADLIRTVSVDLTLEGIGALGLLVVVRTILSFSIDVEVNGALPWRAGPIVPDERD